MSSPGCRAAGIAKSHGPATAQWILTPLVVALLCSTSGSIFESFALAVREKAVVVAAMVAAMSRAGNRLRRDAFFMASRPAFACERGFGDRHGASLCRVVSRVKG